MQKYAYLIDAAVIIDKVILLSPVIWRYSAPKSKDNKSSVRITN